MRFGAPRPGCYGANSYEIGSCRLMPWHPNPCQPAEFEPAARLAHLLLAIAVPRESRSTVLVQLGQTTRPIQYCCDRQVPLL